MRLSFPIRFSLFITLVLTLSGCIGASNIKPKTPDCNIACYITRSNSQGAMLQLVVKAGSLQEEEHERGFAHFVEHMAFNDTQKYPKEALFRKLRELGMEVGSHSNALTDFDNTTYFLVISKASEEQLDRAIGILAQWAQHVQFNQDVVDAEKPILIEEWRYRTPKRASAEIQQLDAMYQNSRYGDRFPVGTIASITAAKAEELQAFYQRWYRADNMSVIVTGGADEATVKKLINKHFTAKPKGEVSEAQHYKLNVKHYPKAQVFVDGHVKQEAVSLRYFVPFNRAITAHEQFEVLLRQGVVQLLEQRLKARLQDADGAITDFTGQWKQESVGTASVAITATLPGKNLELATRLLTEEVALLLAEGVSEQELNQWKKTQQAFYQQQINTDQTREMSMHHFLYGQQMLSHPEWRSLLKKRLPAINPDSMDVIAQELFLQPVHWELQTNTHQKHPAELQLAEWLQGDSQKLGIRRSVANAPGDDLDRDGEALWQIQPTTEAKLLSSRLLGNRVKEWQFANGMTVMHRYSRAAPGKFFFYLSAEGGLNQMPTEQISQARFALDVMGSSGLRQLDGIALAQWLEKQNAELQPALDFFARGLSGQANSDDFEAILQLLHVALTESQVDDSVLARHVENTRQSYFRRGSSKQYILRRYLDTAVYNNHPALKVMTRNDLEPLTKQAMEQVYQDYFYGAQNYRLVIVGDIGRNKVFPKVFKHIATLPASGNNTVEPIQVYPYPKKSMKIDLSGSSERTTQLSTRFTVKKEVLSDYRFDQVYFLTYWINQYLTQELREKLGYTYQVLAEVEGLEQGRPDFTLEVRLDTDPKKVDQVRAALNQQLAEMVQQQPDQRDLERWQSTHRGRLQQFFSHPLLLALALAREPSLGFEAGQVINAQARSQPPTQAQLVEMLKAFLSEDAIRIDTIWRPRP